MILWELYISFVMVGLFCVGGGYASVPLIQTQVIDIHQWLTMKEFMDIFAISQMTPGPIGINAATFVGTKVAGMPGAIVATLGFVTPSLFLMSGMAIIFQKYGNVGAIRGALNGLRPAVVALIGAAGLTFTMMTLFGRVDLQLSLDGFKYLNLVVMVVAYGLVKKKVFGVISTLLFSGALSLVLNYAVAMTR